MSGSDTDDGIEEVEVEHGIRHSRRLTHFTRRYSNALYPAQMMKAEVHYNFSENAALDSLHLLEILTMVKMLSTRQLHDVSDYDVCAEPTGFTVDAPNSR